MTRDELLTKLAMELGEWPVAKTLKMRMTDNGNGTHRMGWVYSDDEYGVSYEEYIKRRAELINRPSWDDAPEWAQWLAQDKRGEWCFYPEKPEQSGTMWINDQPKTGIWVNVHCTGKLPSGHDWRETLEKRPAAKRELNPITSSMTISQAEDSALTTGLCSDGAPCGSPHNPDDDDYCIGCPNEPMTEEEEEMPAKITWPDSIKWQGGYVAASWRELAEQNKRPGRSKYHREIKPGVFVDVYDVLAAWRVTNPALQHLIKKALQPGGRGHKTAEQDMADIVASAKRAAELADS